jgi:hypothetical protein
MKQLVTDPTRFSNDFQTSNILDLLYVSNPDIHNFETHPPLGSSDHSVISTTIEWCTSRKFNTKKQRVVYNYKKANWTLMKKFFRNTPWKSLLVLGDPTKSAEQFEIHIKQAMLNYIPSRTLKAKRQIGHLWFNHNCDLLRKNLLHAWKNFKKNPCPSSKQEYKHKKNAYQAALKQARRNFQLRINEDITNSTSSSDWWSHIRKLQPRSTPPILTMRSTDSSISADPNQIANTLNEFFASHSKTKPSADPPPLPSVESIGDPTFSRQSVLSLLRNLSPQKATGPDGIPNILLKNCALSLAFPLAVLFRQSYSTGIFPTLWKSASVVPIHKSGARDDPSNYRPISLLPAISKVMETIVNNHLKRMLEERKLLSPKQFGFRCSRSTCDLLAILTQKWSDALDQSGSVLLVTLDIAKAFDRVWHAGLKCKFPAFGVHDKLFNWLINYLDNRNQCVLIDGCSSNKLPISAGVPQGSVLGPTLFLMFINDITSTCLNPLYLFADDNSLFRIIRSDETLESATTELQKDLDSLAQWTENWNARFNPTKCEVLLITRKHFTGGLKPLMMYNQKIPEVNSLRLLGMRINSTLSFDEHIQNLAVRGSRALGSLCRASSCLSSHTCTILYKALVRSTIEYGCPIWGGAAQTWLAKLDTIQNRAIRLLKLKDPQSHNVVPLEIRRKTASMLLFRKHLLHPPDPQDMLISRSIPRAHHYAIRNINNHKYKVEPIRSRTAQHFNSFIPRVHRLWNTLPCHVSSTIHEKRFGTLYYRTLLAL